MSVVEEHRSILGAGRRSRRRVHGRRLTSRVSGAVAAAMVVVVAVATPALAHHPIISGQVKCAENDVQVITWTLTHSSRTGSDMVIEAIELSRGTLVGISVGQRLPAPPAPGSTVTGTSTYPGDATGRVVLSVTGGWVDKSGKEVVPDERATARVDLIGKCVESTTTTTTSTTTTTVPATTTTVPATTTTVPATTTTTGVNTQVAGVLIQRPPAAGPAAEATTAAPQVAAAAATAPAELPRTGTGSAVLMGVGVVLVGVGTLMSRAARPPRRRVAFPI